jgi:hypothetical protein
MAWVNPSTVATGDVLTASKWNQDVVENWNALGGAWTSWTPILSQGASTNIAKDVTYSKYIKVGRLVIANFQLRMNASSSGSAGSDIALSLPATAAADDVTAVGNAVWYRAANTTPYNGVLTLAGSKTLVTIWSDSSSGARVGSAPNIAVANGDFFVGTLMYEAAS